MIRPASDRYYCISPAVDLVNFLDSDTENQDRAVGFAKSHLPAKGHHDLIATQMRSLLRDLSLQSGAIPKHIQRYLIDQLEGMYNLRQSFRDLPVTVGQFIHADDH